MIGYKNIISGGSSIMQPIRIPENTRNVILVMNLIEDRKWQSIYCITIRIANCGDLEGHWGDLEGHCGVLEGHCGDLEGHWGDLGRYHKIIQLMRWQTCCFI